MALSAYQILDWPNYSVQHQEMLTYKASIRAKEILKKKKSLVGKFLRDVADETIKKLIQDLHRRADCPLIENDI